MKYPQAGPIGGRLIRRMISFLRQHQLQLPLSSHILVANSGGSDSTALALLLAKYGRKIIPLDQITLLYVNHGWREEDSLQDEEFVQNQALRWGVSYEIHRLPPPLDSRGVLHPDYAGGRSWEDVARKLRKSVFKRRSVDLNAPVFTAHHMDDLAETVLWRLLTGAPMAHGIGIAVRHEVEVRPMLTTRKQELIGFLKEEGERWRSDPTNEDTRFLRAKMRKRLLPEMESIFPRAIENLAQLGLDSQGKRAPSPKDQPNSLI